MLQACIPAGTYTIMSPVQFSLGIMIPNQGIKNQIDGWIEPEDFWYSYIKDGWNRVDKINKNVPMVQTLLILNLIPVLCSFIQLGNFGTWHLVSGATNSSSLVTSKLKQYTGTLRTGLIVTPQCSLRLQSHSRF